MNSGFPKQTGRRAGLRHNIIIKMIVMNFWVWGIRKARDKERRGSGWNNTGDFRNGGDVNFECGDIILEKWEVDCRD